MFAMSRRFPILQFGVGRRGYQTNEQFYSLFKKNIGPSTPPPFTSQAKLKVDYASETVDTKKALEIMRQMISLRSLKTSGSSTSPPLESSPALRVDSTEYKNGLRALSMVAGADGGISKPTLTIGEIEKVLSSDNGVTWRLLEELLSLGFSSELESLDETQKAVVMFNRVHGIGKVKAETYVQYGARSFEDLLKSTEKEYGRKVSEGQKLAMEYHHEMEVMIPREEVAVFHGLSREALKKADPTLNFAIMGSYRRGEPVSSDIDMVVWHESYQKLDPDAKVSKKGPPPGSLMDKVLTSLESAGLLEDGKYIAKGEKKAMALTRLPSSPHPGSIHRQIDIRLCPMDSLPYMLLGNTGDDTLMRILRGKAVEKGWILNEYGMGERDGGTGSVVIRKGTHIKVGSEEEIFEKLGVPYLPPQKRSWSNYKSIMRGRNLVA